MNRPFASLPGIPVLLASLSMLAGAAPTAGAPASACALLAAPAEQLTMRVPFEVVDGRIYVEAKVNGAGPFRFAVDTGASGWGRADSSLVAKLDLPIGKPELNSDGVSSSEVDTTRFATLEVGGLVRENLEVMTRDYSSSLSAEAAIAGIVGREYFADGVLIIDYPARTLSFAQTLALTPDQTDVLSYERAFRIPIQIGELRTQGNLDTGANVSFVLPKAVFDQVGGTALVRTGPGQLAHSQVDANRSTVAGPFRIGGVSLSGIEVRVSERYPEVLIGAHALQNSTVLIDQRSQSVAICASER